MDIAALMNSTHFAHSQQVAKISSILAQLAGYTAEETEVICQAALFHDIGKNAIPHTILNKPGKLTPEEFHIVQTHTTIGQEQLTREVQALGAAIIVAQQHHERLDGSGYMGLGERHIHPYAKLVAVADVFDALVSRRSYKEPWDIERTSKYLRGLAGIQFDCQFTTLLLDNMAQILALYDGEKTA